MTRTLAVGLVGFCACVAVLTTGHPAHTESAAEVQLASLCTASEHIIFSCTVKQGKVLSLCGSRDLTKDRGYLQYRFGLPAKVELEFPKDRTGTQQKFHYSHYFRAQVDMTEISFTNEGYQYLLFDTYNGEEKPAVSEQGITITPPGKQNGTTLQCHTKPKADFSILADILPHDDQ